mgnify:CR=1 FL=1
MKVNGILYAYERNRNNTRDQLMLLVSNPTDVLAITLDESQAPKPELEGKTVAVDVSVSSYRDKPQYYQTSDPVALGSSSPSSRPMDGAK